MDPTPTSHTLLYANNNPLAKLPFLHDDPLSENPQPENVQIKHIRAEY
jgi:hypothetical protein